MSRAPLLARALFPNRPSALQRKFFRELCLAALLGLLVAACCGTIIYFSGQVGVSR